MATTRSDMCVVCGKDTSPRAQLHVKPYDGELGMVTLCWWCASLITRLHTNGIRKNDPRYQPLATRNQL